LAAPFDVYLVSLLFTLTVELPLLALLLHGRSGWREAVLAGLLGTCATHPLLWYAWPHLFDSYWLYITTGELLVVAVESVVIFAVAKPGSLWTALGASALVNAASYLGGAVLKALGWWPGVS